MNDFVLEFKNVCIDYPLKKYTLRAVNNVSLNVRRGKITALVGESGSGKTTLSSSIIKCISEPGIIAQGEVIFHGKDDAEYHIEKMNDKELRNFRWNKVSMVFQAAQSALNPVLTVRQHFYETLDEHNIKLTKQEKEERCLKLLDYVKLDAERVLKCYPHELSGGMKQRVMIALSLLLDPELIILDEPTTALDVITQSYIFNLLKEINETMGITMLLMTHDISVVASFADYIAVMYGGTIMEYGRVIDVFKNKKHPYTKGLINATPSIVGDMTEVKPIEGSPPNMLALPTGCVFHNRCEKCMKKCTEKAPEVTTYKDGSFVKCYLYSKEEK
ncbi:MAG TPA: ABC transporter ATP-binding protein [Erysipelotrichaceae bacterium]|nr:ABC transporter ATP-binding protein [Erysipelotrichaceae bacterium]